MFDALRPANLDGNRRDQQWAIDFVHDRMANGRTIRVLSVVDTFTANAWPWKWIFVYPADASPEHSRVIAMCGKPERIRMAVIILAWGIDQPIGLVHIQPGKPIQNAHVESFQGRLRDECLNTQWFQDLWHAWRQIAAWRGEFNQQRRHSSLDYLTPNEFTQACLAATASPVTQ